MCCARWLGTAFCVLLAVLPARVMGQAPPPPIVLLEQGGLRLTGTLEGLAAGLAHSGIWYGLAPRFGGVGFVER